MEKPKRERSINFTQEETNLLISLLEAKKHIIENKKSDATTWQEKEEAWKDIENRFNSASGLVFRDHKHLKLKYEALKRDIRKKSAIIVRTGGGTSTAPSLTPAEEKVMEMILLSVEGNESKFDSDLDLPNLSENIYIEIQEQEIEPPNKKVCVDTQKETLMQRESYNDLTESHWKEWNPTVLKSKPKEKRPFDNLTEERLEIVKIQRQLLTEELEQKLIQRKILEKELEHKDIIHDLEKEHLLLKIQILKKHLEEK